MLEATRWQGAALGKPQVWDQLQPSLDSRHSGSVAYSPDSPETSGLYGPNSALTGQCHRKAEDGSLLAIWTEPTQASNCLSPFPALSRKRNYIADLLTRKLMHREGIGRLIASVKQRQFTFSIATATFIPKPQF